MNYYRTSIWVIIFSILVLISTVICYDLARAQRSNQWSPRERIPGTHDEAETPYLIADQNRTIHAFHSQPIGEDQGELAIIYSRWTLDGGWTNPVDVTLPPFGRLAVVEGAVLDQNGLIHIIFYGGEEGDANIYYTRAPAGIADRATDWSKPEVIGEKAIVETATMVGDDLGNKFVLYGGNRDGAGVYFVNSSDGGKTWTLPTPVYLTHDVDLFAFEIGMYLDQERYLHAVWAVNNSSGQGQAVYYIKLDTRTMIWSEPIPLVNVGQSDLRLGNGLIDRIGWPSVIKYDDALIVIYMVCSPCERRMRISNDDGQTWTAPVEPFHPSRGEHGRAEFAVDSNNVLHVIFGDRARGWSLWHSIWQNGYWVEPEPVIPPTESQAYQEGPETFAPQRPGIIISNGNVFLVTWQTDRGHYHNGTWYSYKTLDTPELPMVPLPTFVDTSIEDPSALPTIPYLTPTPVGTLIDQADLQSYSSTNPGSSMVFSVVPVIALISVIIIYHSLRSYKK